MKELSESPYFDLGARDATQALKVWGEDRRFVPTMGMPQPYYEGWDSVAYKK
ncbi:MAG: hypothetical protein ABIG30_00125 [Candidatus Aenigmatarchaeota archaeon]